MRGVEKARNEAYLVSYAAITDSGTTKRKGLFHRPVDIGIKKRPWGLIFLLAFLITGCLRIEPLGADYGDKIRVLIIRGAAEVEIKGSDLGPLRIKRVSPGEVAINGHAEELPVTLYPEDEFIYINGRPYRGAIDVLEGKDGIMVVDELFLEAYLVGIINNEISSRWPEDVIKAQAVIARTYALYQKGRRPNEPYHLESSVMGQVYNGAHTEDESASRAVRETSGEILAYGGEPALTVYHSNAGGMTDSSKDVWARYYPYLNPVESPHDKASPNFLWEFSITAQAFRKLLNGAGYTVGEPEAISLEEVTRAGRIKALTIKDALKRKVTLSGEDLRKVLGYSNLKSTVFGVARSADSFIFRGKGSGHGVGLSQWGAKGMAEAGYSYRDILRHYYPGTEIMKAY